MDPKRAVISISGFGNAIFILSLEQGFAELPIAGVGAPGWEGLMSLRVCVGGCLAQHSHSRSQTNPVICSIKHGEIQP